MGKQFHRQKVGLSGQSIPLRNRLLPSDRRHWLEGLREWDWRAPVRDAKTYVEQAYSGQYNLSFYRWFFVKDEAAYVAGIRAEVQAHDAQVSERSWFWHQLLAWWYGIGDKRRLCRLYDLRAQLEAWLGMDGNAESDQHLVYADIKGSIDLAQTLGFVETAKTLHRLSCLATMQPPVEPMASQGAAISRDDRRLSDTEYASAKAWIGSALRVDASDTGWDLFKRAHTLPGSHQVDKTMAHLQGQSRSADLVLVEVLDHAIVPHVESFKALMARATVLDANLKYLGSKGRSQALVGYLHAYRALRNGLDEMRSRYFDLQGSCRPELADAKLYAYLLEQHRLAYESLAKCCDPHMLSIESMLASGTNEVMRRSVAEGMDLWLTRCQGDAIKHLDHTLAWYDQLLPGDQAPGFLRGYKEAITEPLQALASALEDYPEPWHRVLWESLKSLPDQLRWALDPKVLLEEVVRPLMLRSSKVDAWLDAHGASLANLRPAYEGKETREMHEEHALDEQLRKAKQALKTFQDGVEGEIRSKIEAMRLQPDASPEDEDRVRDKVNTSYFLKNMAAEAQVHMPRQQRDVFKLPKRLEALEASWSAYQAARSSYEALPQGLRMAISCEVLHVLQYTDCNIAKRHGTEEEAWLHYVRPLNHYLLYFRPAEGVKHDWVSGFAGEARGTWHVLGRDHEGRIRRLDLNPGWLGSPWRKHVGLLQALTEVRMTGWRTRSTVEVMCYPLLETLSGVLGVPLLSVGPSKASAVVTHDRAIRDLYREKYLPVLSVLYDLDELLRRDRHSVVNLYASEPERLDLIGWKWLQKTRIADYEGDVQYMAPLLRHRYAYDVVNALAVRRPAVMANLEDVSEESAEVVEEPAVAAPAAAHPGGMLAEPGRDRYRIEGQSYGMDLYDHVGRGHGRRWLDGEERDLVEAPSPELSQVQPDIEGGDALNGYVHGKELVRYNQVYENPMLSLRFWDRERGHERYDYLLNYALVNFNRLYHEFKVALLSQLRTHEVDDVSAWLASVRSDARLQNLMRQLDDAHRILLAVHPDHNMRLLSEYIQGDCGKEVIEGARMLYGHTEDEYQAIKDVLADDGQLRAFVVKEYLREGDRGCRVSRRIGDTDIHQRTYLEEHYREISITGERSMLLGIRRQDEEIAVLRAQLLSHGITPETVRSRRGSLRPSRSLFSGFGHSLFGRGAPQQQPSPKKPAPVYEGDQPNGTTSTPGPAASQAVYE